jgi:ABC-type multidrug transport system permease subunit
MAASAVAALIRADYQERSTFRFAVAFDFAFGILNLVIFFYISRVLRHPSHAQLHGAHTYFAFAAIGVAFMLVTGAAAAGLARRIREDEMTGTLEALCHQPIGAASLALGLAGFQFLFAIARAGGYLVVAGLWLGLGVSHANWIGAALVLAVSGLALVAIGIALAAVVVVVGQGGALAQVTVFALGFLGGAYFPLVLLPGWLRTLSYANPTRYALEGLRSTMFGGSWAPSLAILAGFAIALVPLSVLLFRFALSVSVRRGLLTRG